MRKKPGLLALAPYFIVLVLAIGLRQKVGMDWNNYLAIHYRLGGFDLEQALISTEPGFSLLAWNSERFGFGVYGTNMIAALIFVSGLFSFARTTRNDWMALSVAIPYLVVVVAMSAVRQTIAIGILFFVFANWRQSGLGKRIAWIVLASTFHLSAIFALAFVILESNLTLLRKSIVVAIFSIVFIYILAATSQFSYYSELYISSSGGSGVVESSGALAHVLLIAFPGAIFLYFRKRWEYYFGENQMIFAMAVLSLVSIPGALFFSTAVDRMSLYLYALPLVVYANIPRLVSGFQAIYLKIIIILGNFLLLYFWLEFANSAAAYLSYKNLIFNF